MSGFGGWVPDRSCSASIMFRPAGFIFISISEGCELLSGMLSSSCMFVLVFQDSLDELEMNDYWKEVENIASSERGAGRGDGEGDGETHEEEHQKIPEGRICIVHGYKCKQSSFLSEIWL